jgi:hypothetical protein
MPAPRTSGSSPTMLMHTICRVLKTYMLLDRPLLAGPAGFKDGRGNSSNNDGNASGSGRELDYAPDWDGCVCVLTQPPEDEDHWPLPPIKAGWHLSPSP